MPVYRLDDRPIFPDPEDADPSGLLAIGGDLSIPRLLEAYRRGIFPWSGPDEPLLWWCPDPRLILEAEGLRVSRSLRATIRRGTYQVRFDTAFADVVRGCATAERPGEAGTWITPEVEHAYNDLFRLGFAHSAESWVGGELVGGLYGVQLGRAFFGESMFSRRTDASKVALAALSEELKRRAIPWVDCQVTTDHLLSLGAREVPRSEFLRRLAEALRFPTRRERWGPGP